MKRLLFVAVALASAPAAADDKPTTTFTTKVVPSGPVKVFKGPEGELVAMVEITGGKEMLVQLRNVAGHDARSRRYLVEDLGNGRRSVYLDWKRGSKPYRRVLLASYDRVWRLFPPNRPTDEVPLRFSEPDTAKTKVEDIVKALAP